MDQDEDVTILDEEPIRPAIPFSKEEDEAMLEFLYTNIYDPETKKVEQGRAKWKARPVWKRFRSETGTTRTVSRLLERFAQLVDTLNQAEMNVMKKLIMCFALQIPISDDFRKLLCEDAVVKVDAENLIQYYKKEGDLELQLDPHTKPSMRFTDDEEATIWKFILDRADNSQKAALRTHGNRFWEDFKKETGSVRSAVVLAQTLHKRLLPNLHSKNIDVEMKLKLYRACKVPMTESILETLRKKALVLLDMNNLVDGYVVYDRKRQRTAEGKGLSQSFSVKEEDEMWHFILGKIRNSKTGIAEKIKENYRGCELWRQFKVQFNGLRTSEEYMKRFTLSMMMRVDLTRFAIQTKAEFYYGLQVPVDEEFLEKLKEDADVEVDGNNCLTRYQRKSVREFCFGNDQKNAPKRAQRKSEEAKVLKKQKTELESSDEEQSSDEDEGGESDWEPPQRPRVSTPCDEISGEKLTIKEQLEIKRKKRMQKKQELEEKLLAEVTRVKASSRQEVVSEEQSEEVVGTLTNEAEVMEMKIA